MNKTIFNESINRKKLATFLATAPLALPYYALLTIGDFIEDCSKKIKSERELQSLMNGEADKWGINKKRLIGILCPYPAAESFIFGLDIRDKENPKKFSPEQIDGQYVIEGKAIELGGINATEAKARHEMYHLAKGHCKKNNGGYRDCLRYLFFDEPCAIRYSLFGYKRKKAKII